MHVYQPHRVSRYSSITRWDWRAQVNSNLQYWKRYDISKRWLLHCSWHLKCRLKHRPQGYHGDNNSRCSGWSFSSKQTVLVRCLQEALYEGSRVTWCLAWSNRYRYREVHQTNNKNNPRAKFHSKDYVGLRHVSVLNSTRTMVQFYKNSDCTVLKAGMCFTIAVDQCW